MPRHNRSIPLNWDPEIVRILSLVQPQDIDLARIWWQKYAPAVYEALMDSKIADQLAGLSGNELAIALNTILLDNESQEAWKAAGLLLFFIGGHYWRQNGRRVAWRLIRGALDRVLRSGSGDVSVLCDQFRSGTISLANWQNQMATMIKTSSIAAAMAAAGGAGMSQLVIAQIESRVQTQLGFLQDFAARIAGGLPLDGNVCRVMQMYLSGARATYHLVEAANMFSTGFTEYRNILGPTEDHCTGGGSCLEVTAAGWRPLGSLPPIGSRLCLSNCLCEWQYRRFVGIDEVGDSIYDIR